jgi:hypothetical protein
MAIGTPIIVRKPSLTVTYGATAAIDLSAGIRSVDISEEEEITDLPTFENPDQTVSGKVTTTITIPFYWTDEFAAALEPHLGEDGEWSLVYNTGDTSETVWTGSVARVPFGMIEPNAPIEAELNISVTVAPVRQTIA